MHSSYNTTNRHHRKSAETFIKTASTKAKWSAFGSGRGTKMSKASKRKIQIEQTAEQHFNPQQTTTIRSSNKIAVERTGIWPRHTRVPGTVAHLAASRIAHQNMIASTRGCHSLYDCGGKNVHAIREIAMSPWCCRLALGNQRGRMIKVHAIVLDGG
jgi:hypothetical protein